MTIHLIANAHLDPVWLWDWREGFNEGIATCRAMLDLLDETPDFSFIRGEAAIYRHIEQTEPYTFARIKDYVAKGRWDVVGGTWIQPDTNLPSTETLCRHFQVGRRYFESRFGRTPRVAWAADSFGHSAGLPEILAASGMDSLAFTRPAAAQMPLEKPAFWWRGPSGARVLAYRPPVGWYGSERDEMPRRLDEALAVTAQGDLENVGVFYGVGNHGGGATRRYLREITAWQSAHPEITLVHSGLHRFFAALREELGRRGDDFLPTVTGELGFCLRGCYSSSAKTKFLYRRAEVAAARVETLAALLDGTENADTVWESVLFNSFHDILPGTSIERALDDQHNQLGGALFEAQKIEFRALNVLAARVDTSVGVPADDFPCATPFLVWNPHPRAFSGWIELESCLDYRPLFSYQNRSEEVPLEVRGPNKQVLPFQRIAAESDFFAAVPWRARVLVPVDLPPLGWSVFSLGWVENPQTAAFEGVPVESGADFIANAHYRIEAGEGLQIFHRGRSLFQGRLRFETLRDEWGSWGGLNEEPASLNLREIVAQWRLTEHRVLESGPLRAKIWTRWQGGDSWLDLTLSLCSGQETVNGEVRLLWNERAARLQMALDAGVQTAIFDVPGASATRGAIGHVPGGRWVCTETFGFASDALYDFEIRDGALNATLARATRYASDRVLGADEQKWRPTLDCGELKFRFLLAPPHAEHLAHGARELENPPLVQSVVASPGECPRAGSLAGLAPDNVELLALARDENGFWLRVRETSGQRANVRLSWNGAGYVLGEIGAFEIKTWRMDANYYAN